MRRGTRIDGIAVITLTAVVASFVSAVLFSTQDAVTALGVGILVLLAIALYNSRFDAGRHSAYASLLFAVFLGAIAVLVHFQVLQRVIPVCGDGVCAGNECNDLCRDCNAAQCGDGVCQIPIERCDTSADCSCAEGTVCSPGRNGSDTRGCAPIGCGDKFCDAGETRQNCCTDCGCPQGFACSQNACIFQPPEVTIYTTLISSNISATSIAAAPNLTNGSGTTQPLAAAVIRDSVSPAIGVRVTFSIPGLASDVVTLGDMPAGYRAVAAWYLDPSTTWLTVTKDRNTTVSVTVEYTDAENVAHTIHRAYPITIRSRDTLDPFGDLSFFITPGDVATHAKTPEFIWNELSEKGLILEEGSDPSRVQFPAETLARGKGTANDFAVLVASAYVAAGLEPSLVHAQNGTYLWVRLGNDYVVLDPSMLGQPFAQATLNTIPDLESVTPVARIWHDRKASPLSITPSYIPGLLVRAQKQVAQTCSGTTATYTVENDGLVPADMCAKSLFVDKESVVSAKDWCFTIDGGETQRYTHAWAGIGGCIQPEAVFTLENEFLQ